ncbi:hypothetical protein AB0J74_23115 [Asanoa sp. NPDC049573]|uniref:hypothetical protein n=1 Tax=Asanoa sp. NPDC049573 TaxID=3155396 RepID=UPI003412D0B5
MTDLAGGDPRRSRQVRRVLAALAASDDDLMREMSRALLSGEMTLRQVADSEVYGAALSRSFARFWSDYERLGPEERAALARRADGGE